VKEGGLGVSTESLAANLRRIRNARGLTQAEVASKAGISRVGYNAIEAGTSAARIDTVGRLAVALGVPIPSLLETPVLLEHVRFRAQKRLVRREDILSRVGKWLHDYRDLEQLLGVELASPLGKFRRPPAYSSGRALQVAVEARTALGLKAGDSIRDICGLLDDQGIKVSGIDASSEGFFGLSIGRDHGGPAIVVNVWNRISVERWIFTAVHELGHLLLHQGAYDVSKLDENQQEETEANTFASHFLMPEKVFRQEWDEARGLPLVERVLKVKRIFRVSWKTVIYRAFPGDPKIWPRFQGEYRAMTGRTLSANEEPSRLSPFEFKADRRDRLLRQALERGVIELERAADILGIPSTEMAKRAAGWTA
jgi:Zn-dependent peptidase ImmA (M78 family)/transcriptional regulator with XRE-family HTH domain